jgi:signal peptidase
MRRALRTVRGVAGVVVTVLLVATVVGLAGLFWLVRQEDWLFQAVATGSMEPTIPTGSVILSRPVAPEAIEPGDVIVFAAPNGATVAGGEDGMFDSTEQMLVTHRVVAVTSDDGTSDGGIAFRTKGDGNEDEDPWLVTPDMLRARYVAHVPVLGTVVSRPDLRRWLYLAVAAAGVVVIVAEGRSVVRELRARPDDAAGGVPDEAPDDDAAGGVPDEVPDGVLTDARTGAPDDMPVSQVLAAPISPSVWDS